MRLRWTSVNSSPIAGSTMKTATPNTINKPASVALGAAASSMVSFSGQEVGPLRDAPAPDHGGHRANRQRAGSAPIAGSKTTTATPKTTSTPVSVALGAAASEMVSFSGRR